VKQRTLAKETRITGTGLHTGHQVNMTFKPAAAGEGISFVRVDLPGAPVIRLGTLEAIFGGDAGRYSAIKNGDAIIYTVEHVVSALAGAGIDNIRIEMDNDEPAGIDGSAAGFLKAFREAGIQELAAEQTVFVVREPISVSRNGACVMIAPADDFKVSYSLEYPHPMLKQSVTLTVTGETYERDIAPCRTFCLQEEAEAIRAKGLGLGANYDNTVVYGAQGPVKNTARFSDEAARHKVLDCIGDLYLLGFAIKGHVFAFKSGHALNRELLKKIAEQKAKHEAQPAAAKAPQEFPRTLDVRGIMKIIPHRFPFLLVDRIMDFEPGKRAVGIKNVTINEAFFQGHFPVRPVMPGVLMVEAMAQVAAVVALSKPELAGKIGFFMSVDGVKFRKVVEPGDQLVMEVEIVKARARIAQAKGVCKVDGQVVCEAEMGFAFGE
jgi:UDP-3-O-[3-hydroxymyristoyl] N-acetylglucosamine deacetylase/3-hydroxyacyl-[acyl-carrier-protein] dehydratase